MSEQDKRAAQEHAARAAHQSKDAAKNLGRAAAEGADYVADEVTEEVGEAAKQVRRLNPNGLASLAGDMGWGFFTLSVSLYTGAIAYNKFRTVYENRGRAMGR